MRSRMLSSSARRAGARVSTSCSNSSSSATNSWIALSERVASSPTLEHRRSAEANGIRSRSAKFSMHASARSPMPRFGVLMTRRRLTMSVGLATTFR